MAPPDAIHLMRRSVPPLPLWDLLRLDRSGSRRSMRGATYRRPCEGRHKECTHLSSRAIEPYRVSQPQIRRPAPDHFRDQDSYTTRKMAGLIQIKVRRHGTGTLIDRGAGDEG